jgi:transcriptional regulator with XRE-family HTH domain
MKHVAASKRLPLTLADLRERQGLTQVKLAKKAKITQSEVSRTEQQDDCLVSTLDRYAAALGGKLLLHVEIAGKRYPVTL